MPDVSISFSGCGFLGMYHVGVLAYLQNTRKLPALFYRALGSSSGAIVAAALVLGIPANLVKDRFQTLARLARRAPLGPFNTSFDLPQILTEEMMSILPEDAHYKASQRLTIALTSADMKRSFLIDNFTSREELMNCICCSCFIPGFSGYRAPRFRDEEFIDGGFTNNQPVAAYGRTVRVSGFAGGSDISPGHRHMAKTVRRFGGEEIEFSVANGRRALLAFFPSSDLGSLYSEGFSDARTFFSSSKWKGWTGDPVPRSTQ